MVELGNRAAVQNAVVCVGDRLVQGVSRQADAAEAQVELADVDGVECGAEGVGADVQDVVLADRVLVEFELGDVHLRRHDVLDHRVVGVLAVGEEEDVLVQSVAALDPAEHRHDAGAVAIADVVLAARCLVSAAFDGSEHQVGGVDVGPVGLLGQAEGRDGPTVEQVGGALARVGVGALPHRPEPEHGHLPRVPVVQAIEAEDLRQLGHPGGVPALVGVPGAVGGRGEEGREQLLARREVQEVLVEDLIDIVLEQTRLAAILEPVDGGLQEPACFAVEFGEVVLGGVKQLGLGGDVRILTHGQELTSASVWIGRDGDLNSGCTTVGGSVGVTRRATVRLITFVGAVPVAPSA